MLDYQAAVVITDDGCVAGSVPFVDPSMSAEDQQLALAETFVPTLGENAERPFMLLEAALSPANTGDELMALVPGPSRSFLLDEPALAWTVEVEVDGAPRASGWSFDEAEQALSFDVAQVARSSVVIRYEVAQECGG